jgi:SAM-dependent MidA family methyltransferase
MDKTDHLREIIVERIRQENGISFREYMEMALYYPGLGYYTSSGDKIGITGDYYTSPALTGLFGQLIGKQLEEMWRLLGETDFTVVEYGAGTGILCRDILAYLKKNEKLYRGLRYCIIEKSPAMREKEFASLGPHEKVSWHDSIQDIRLESGCVLTNEVLDNFSVHKVLMRDRLMEVHVVKPAGRFEEVVHPAPDELNEYLDKLDVKLPKGFCTEINLEAVQWLGEVAGALKKGFVMTIDYGYPSHELYCENHSSGTLKCYSKHMVNDDPYYNLGEQDITAHVNFSALSRWGEAYGLSICGYTDQSHFMHALGFADYLRKLEKEKRPELKEKGAALLHTFLLDMGSKFKVLIQQKGLPDSQLSGLLFSRKVA